MYDSQAKTETSEHRQALAEFIRDETDGGREIMRFFLDVMRNRVEDAKLCHRIAAARELAKHGSGEAREFLKAVARSENGHTPTRTPAKPRQNDELADFIKLETDDGKEIVRFLLDVMRNRIEDVRMGQRISVGKELLKRAFDYAPGVSGDGNESGGAKECRNESCLHFRYARTQTAIVERSQKDLVKIYGSEQAATVAIRAAAQHRRETMWDHDHVPDHDSTPVHNPEDDPYGKGSHEYRALRIIFADNQTIRIANKAVEEYKKQLAADLETKEKHSDEDSPENRRHHSESRQDHPVETLAKPPLPEGGGWGEGEPQVESRPSKPAIADDSEVTQKSPAESLAKPPLPEGEGWGEGEPQVESMPVKPAIAADSEVSQKSPAEEDPKPAEHPDPTDPVILSEAEGSPAPGPERPRRSGRRKKHRLERRLLAASRSGPVPSLTATGSDRGPPTAPFP